MYSACFERSRPLLRYGFILALGLTAAWLTLSGYFKPMLLILGVISIATVIAMTARMRLLDHETAPYLSIPRTLSYFVWLFAEIVKANVEVVRAVMSPNMEVSPTLVKVPLPQDTDIGRVMFANSITLTPGTVSVLMEDDHILVHALLEDMSAPEGFDEMAERSAWAVDETLTVQDGESA